MGNIVRENPDQYAKFDWCSQQTLVQHRKCLNFFQYMLSDETLSKYSSLDEKVCRLRPLYRISIRISVKIKMSFCAYENGFDPIGVLNIASRFFSL